MYSLFHRNRVLSATCRAQPHAQYPAITYLTAQELLALVLALLLYKA